MSGVTPLMVVRAVADLHGHLPTVDPCELLLIAGDIVPPTIEGDVEACRTWLSGPFAAWVEQMPVQQVVMVAGNHDLWALDGSPPAAQRVTYLADQDATVQTTLGPLRVHGSPWALAYAGGAFEAHERELLIVAGLISDDTDILILHGPPHGCADAISRQGPRRGSEPGPRWQDHVGSRAYREAIELVQPAQCVFGHVHSQGGGTLHVNATRCANVAILDDRYRPVRGASAFVLARDDRGGLWAEPLPAPRSAGEEPGGLIG